mmetsp:Transcript_132426/g.313945  ORF Transcript_132426/g.313945 Transcript_132426/m.313945 type:complete len:151 (+) Transcript_132426:89-541(+)
MVENLHEALYIPMHSGTAERGNTKAAAPQHLRKESSGSVAHICFSSVSFRRAEGVSHIRFCCTAGTCECTGDGVCMPPRIWALTAQRLSIGRPSITGEAGLLGSAPRCIGEDTIAGLDMPRFRGVEVQHCRIGWPGGSGGEVTAAQEQCP